MFDRIESRPGKLDGQPCIVGSRLTVRRVLSLLSTYPDRDELFREFPELDEESIRQVLLYAQANLPDRVALVSELD